MSSHLSAVKRSIYMHVSHLAVLLCLIYYSLKADSVANNQLFIIIDNQVFQMSGTVLY